MTTITVHEYLIALDRIASDDRFQDAMAALSLAYGDVELAIDIFNKREARSNNKPMRGEALSLSETLPLVSRKFKEYHSLKFRQF